MCGNRPIAFHQSISEDILQIEPDNGVKFFVEWKNFIPRSANSFQNVGFVSILVQLLLGGR